MTQTPYEQGVRARTEERDIFENPYSLKDYSDSIKWIEWNDGWHEADKGDDCENGTRGDE